MDCLQSYSYTQQVRHSGAMLSLVAWHVSWVAGLKLLDSLWRVKMSDATLEFTVRESYGNTRYYPNNRMSRCIVKHLMNQKCLNYTQVKRLKIVGGFVIKLTADIEEILT